MKPVSLTLTRLGDARALPKSPRWLIRVIPKLDESTQFATLVHEQAHVYSQVSRREREKVTGSPLRLPLNTIRQVVHSAVCTTLAKRCHLSRGIQDCVQRQHLYVLPGMLKKMQPQTGCPPSFFKTLSATTSVEISEGNDFLRLTFARVEAKSEPRSNAKLPIIYCCGLDRVLSWCIHRAQLT